MSSTCLSIQAVSKKFENHTALNQINLQIESGTVFGLLGPNGAGKTTLIRCITQIIKPDSGQIYFQGHPLAPEDSYQVGYMPEERGLYKKMKVGEQLLYLAQLKNMSKSLATESINQLLERFEMQTWLNKRVEELSKGMQQKVQFIATIINKPPLLILDEPFTGLDPINAKVIQDEIENLRQQGCTIIFSTHRMEQVEEICSQIALINKGECILNGEVKAIRKQYKQNQFEVHFTGQLPSDLNSPFTCLTAEAGYLRIALQANQTSSDLLHWLLQYPIQIDQFAEMLPSIGEIFIQQVNHAQLHN